jgi:hypothetical protein
MMRMFVREGNVLMADLMGTKNLAMEMRAISLVMVRGVSWPMMLGRSTLGCCRIRWEYWPKPSSAGI